MKGVSQLFCKSKWIYSSLSVFIILNCLVPVAYMANTSEPRFFWFPNDDGSGVVKAYLEAEPNSPGRNFDIDKEIRFYLYTVDTRHTPHQLFTNNMDLNHTAFNVNDPVKILIHGFNAQYSSGFEAIIKDAFLTYLYVNVIAVDWSGLAEAPWYFNAVLSARDVSKKVAAFIQILLQRGVTNSQIHILGHSLGAHIAGFTGAELHGQIARITGIDPAAALFFDKGISDRLDSSDASFVDVIHTSGFSVQSPTGLGINYPCGHADFYPNGGKSQPGCGVDLLKYCVHRRGYIYFAESIRTPTGFRSCECDYVRHITSLCFNCNNMAYMGDDCRPNARGSYFLKTNSYPPFARG